MIPIIEYGEYTYGIPRINGEGTLKVGKFCSIAEDVKFVLWGHHTNFFTTYPLGHTSQTLDCPRFESHPIRGEITIGNDVWIGDGATIMYGVKIGNGSIISARSYITKDVKPYSVVGGNPAQFLYTRFNQEIVKLLQDLKWWDLPYEIIRENSSVLMSNDYSKLLEFYNKIKN
jgi:acetyltransferase-like isoleucine patch superfamily enzyme